MRTSTVRVVATVLAIGLLVAACGDDGDEGGSEDTTTTAATAADRGNVDGVLQIGHLAPQTGAFSSMVSSVTTPVQIAIDEINAADGVNGQDVVLAVRDDGTDQTVAASAFDLLLESDNVDVVLGPATSPATLGIIEKVATSGVLVCGGSATASDLSEVDSGGYYFRTAPPDRFQGPALAQVVLADERANPAIIARDDSYGVSLGRSLSRALVDDGATIAGGDVISYDPEGTGLETAVQNVVEAQPDSVIVLGFADDGAAVLSEMIEKGIGPADLPVYTTDGMQSGSLGAAIDPDDPGIVSGIRGTAPAASPSGIEHPFNAKMQETGLPPIFSAYYYDCTILSALAAVKAGSDDPSEMKDAFAENLTGETDCNSFADCKSVLESGGSIHYRGASSSFDSWADFEPDQGVYDVWSFDDSGEPVTEPPSSQIRIG